MTKRTSKTIPSKKPRAKATKAKAGGARPGSGPKPKLGVGAVRSVIKTVRLSAGEHDAQLAAVVRAGAKDWAEWARPILNAAADERFQIKIGTGVVSFHTGQMPPAPPPMDLQGVPGPLAGGPVSTRGGAQVEPMPMTPDQVADAETAPNVNA